MSFAALSWLFAGAVTVHNLEEALWLPAWSARNRRFPSRVTPAQFRLVVAVLTALAWAVAAAAARGPRGSIAALLVCGYALAMLANAVAPHLAVTAVTRSYAPGTASAWLLNVPAGAALVHRGVGGGWVAGATLAWVGPLCVVALLLSLPALFALARAILPRS